jgi:carbonic anhydrase
MAELAPLPEPLLDGYRRFRAGRFPILRDRYQQLAADGQRPATMLIACSDSRAAPEQVFDAAPGDLFVVRNIAGWVPPYRAGAEARATGAALEYAIRALPVEAIIVMGHGSCGGVRAAIDPHYGPPTSEFVGPWIRDIEVIAREAAATTDPGELQHAVEYLTVERAVANLATYPWIAEAIAEGMLDIGGAWFAIASGELDALTATGWQRIDGD